MRPIDRQRKSKRAMRLITRQHRSGGAMSLMPIGSGRAGTGTLLR
jgi:hypothetical protein